MPSNVKAYLYSIINDMKRELLEWQRLAQVNLSLGDFSAYLNCTKKILELADKTADAENYAEMNEYKLQVYENISKNLYNYIPDKSFDIAELTLKNLEKSSDKENLILLCNKMVQGNLTAGNYMKALALTHKVLSLIPPASLNPEMLYD